MASKSGDLIPKIIEAKTREEAIAVLSDTLKALHLKSDFIELVSLRDRMVAFEKEYRTISNAYKNMAFPRQYQDLATTRDNLSFLYRDIQDELSFEVNKNKIYWGEDKKTTIRADSMLELKGNEELKKLNNDKNLSLSSLKDIYGASEGYQEYLNLYSISYGLYQNLISLLSSIRIMTDSVASQASHALAVINKDVK
jgi:hypothetical protein